MTYKSVMISLALILSMPAAATEPVKPLVLQGKYTVAWSGIPLGRVIISAREDATSYRMSIDTKTKGIGALISDEKRIVEAQGTRNDNGEYVPVRYNSRPQKNLDEDTITLTYDENGDIANRVRTHDDDPAWRPPVPYAEVNTSRDPITAAFILRRKLYDATHSGITEVASRTYDGKRLANMKLSRSANARVAVLDVYHDAVNVAVTREPINGYTPKELKKYKKGDPEIRLFFSNDPEFLPIRASAKTPIGELSMTLTEKN